VVVVVGPCDEVEEVEVVEVGPVEVGPVGLVTLPLQVLFNVPNLISE
jgi:hypothetical protein